MTTAGTRPTAQKRPGGRSARIRSAVLAATVDELVAVGFVALTVEGIAQRAGVHKTTIYRRWGDRETLLLDAMLERGERDVPIPDTGSLRQDLIAYATEILASVTTPEVDAVVRSVAAISAQDSKLAGVSRTFWAERLGQASAIVNRAADRGEIPHTGDAALILQSIIAPIYFRLLISREQPDGAFIERLATLIATAAAALPTDSVDPREA